MQRRAAEAGTLAQPGQGSVHLRRYPEIRARVWRPDPMTGARVMPLLACENDTDTEGRFTFPHEWLVWERVQRVRGRSTQPHLRPNPYQALGLGDRSQPARTSTVTPAAWDREAQDFRAQQLPPSRQCACPERRSAHRDSHPNVSRHRFDDEHQAPALAPTDATTNLEVAVHSPGPRLSAQLRGEFAVQCARRTSAPHATAREQPHRRSSQAGGGV